MNVVSRSWLISHLDSPRELIKNWFGIYFTVSFCYWVLYFLKTCRLRMRTRVSMSRLLPLWSSLGFYEFNLYLFIAYLLLAWSSYNIEGKLRDDIINWIFLHFLFNRPFSWRHLFKVSLIVTKLTVSFRIMV